MISDLLASTARVLGRFFDAALQDDGKRFAGVLRVSEQEEVNRVLKSHGLTPDFVGGANESDCSDPGKEQ